MDELWSPSGIYIRVGTTNYDIADPDLPADALGAWLDGLNVDQLRQTVRMLIDRSRVECVGFDAGYPPED